MAAELAYVGARKEIAFSKEAIRGTFPSVAAGDWVAHEGFTFNPMIEKVKDEQARGRIEQTSGASIIRKWGEGDVPMFLGKEFVGDAMNMVFGQAPISSGGPTFTHNWGLLNSNQHLSYGVTVKDPIAGFKQYALSMLNEATFEFGRDDYVKLAMNHIADQEQTSSETQTSYSVTEEFFIPQHLTLFTTDSYGNIDAAPGIKIADGSLAITKNVVQYWAHGQVNPCDIINQRTAVGGSLTLIYENTDFRDLGLNDTAKALRIRLDDGAGVVLDIDLPEVQFENWNDSEDNEAFMNNEIEFFGIRNDSDGLILAELQNEVSSY